MGGAGERGQQRDQDQVGACPASQSGELLPVPLGAQGEQERASALLISPLVRVVEGVGVVAGVLQGGDQPGAVGGDASMTRTGTPGRGGGEKPEPVRPRGSTRRCCAMAVTGSCRRTPI